MCHLQDYEIMIMSLIEDRMIFSPEILNVYECIIYQTTYIYLAYELHNLCQSNGEAPRIDYTLQHNEQGYHPILFERLGQLRQIEYVLLHLC